MLTGNHAAYDWNSILNSITWFCVSVGEVSISRFLFVFSGWQLSLSLSLLSLNP